MTDTVPTLTTPPAVRFHSLYGVLDVLLFADGLYRKRGIVLRSLADRNHFKLPGPTGRSGAAQAVAGARGADAAGVGMYAGDQSFDQNLK